MKTSAQAINGITPKTKLFTTRNMCSIGVLSALSAVVMLLEFPLWFAPGFYKFDFSEIIVLIGAFSMGPVAGIIIEFLKILINTMFTSSTTMYIGELSNFIIGCTFVVPASLIYQKSKTKKQAVIGMIIGTISMTVFGSLLNYFVLLPAYSHFYFTPISDFVKAGQDENSLVKDIKTLVLFATAPFNLFKGTVCSLITFIVYKHLSPILHGKFKQ